jgi:hypothetical protein
MRHYSKAAALVTALCIAFNTSLAQEPNGTPAQHGFGLKNQTMTLRLLSPLNTATANEGDQFTLVVESPAVWQGGIVTGRITKINRPQRGVGKGKAEIKFAFEQLTWNERTESISANLGEVSNSKGVSNVDEEGRVIGKTSNKKRFGAFLAGAAAGALIGGLEAGGSGAAIGAAAGAGAGLIIGLSMTTTGSDIEFQPGSHFTLTVSDARSQPGLTTSPASTDTSVSPAAPPTDNDRQSSGVSFSYPATATSASPQPFQARMRVDVIHARATVLPSHQPAFSFQLKNLSDSITLTFGSRQWSVTPLDGGQEMAQVSLPSTIDTTALTPGAAATLEIHTNDVIPGSLYGMNELQLQMKSCQFIQSAHPRLTGFRLRANGYTRDLSLPCP